MGHWLAERRAGRRLTRSQTWIGMPWKWTPLRNARLRLWAGSNPAEWRRAKAWQQAERARSRAAWFEYERVRRESGKRVAVGAIREIFAKQRDPVVEQNEVGLAEAAE